MTTRKANTLDHVAIVLLTLVLALAGTSCKSDHEKIEDTLEAYAEAVVVHRAPYNAYVHLDPEDKEHVSVEAYASNFEESEPPLPQGTRVSIGDVSIKDGLARSTVKLSPPEGEAEERIYVLRRDQNKWRVWLGLETLASMRKNLDDARRLADDGAIEEAREKLEQVAATPFRASRPERFEEEASALRQKLSDRERAVQLDARLTAAMNGELALMKSEAVALAAMISTDDEKFYPRLVKLQETARAKEKKTAIEGFALEEVRARAYRDAWGTFREARFKATNTTGRPIAKLKVRIDLLNAEGEPPVATLDWQVVEEGTTLAPGATLEVKREIEKAPKAWDAKNIAATVTDVAFADEPKNDEG